MLYSKTKKAAWWSILRKVTMRLQYYLPLAITQSCNLGHTVLAEHKMFNIIDVCSNTNSVQPFSISRSGSMLLRAAILCINVFNPPSVHGFHSLVGNILCYVLCRNIYFDSYFSGALVFYIKQRRTDMPKMTSWKGDNIQRTFKNNEMNFTFLHILKYFNCLPSIAILVKIDAQFQEKQPKAYRDVFMDHPVQ